MKDKQFKVTILGSGTCVPSLKRSSASALIEICGKKILLDSGHGTIKRLLDCNIHINDIDMILYTHIHPDHTSEIIPLLFASKYGKRRQKELKIYGGPGFKDFFDNLNMAYKNWLSFPGVLEITELESESKISFNDFEIETVKTEHIDSSVAYKITGFNRSMVYSGDTDFSDDLIKFSEKSNLLILECSHPDNQKVKGHLTPSLAGMIADSAKVKKLVLTHFYPECEKVDIEKELGKTYSGEFLLGEDLLSFNLIEE